MLTHGEQVPVGLQHHVPVQGPLGRVQAGPLLRSKLDGHVLEGQLCLRERHLGRLFFPLPPLLDFFLRKPESLEVELERCKDAGVPSVAQQK